MKILILSSNPTAILDNGKINNQSTIYAYFFNKWLKTYPDCEITNGPIIMAKTTISSLPEYDFCILMINRGAIVIGDKNFDELRKKIKYHIITICGSNAIRGKEDVLLYILGKKKPKTLKTYWGADFDMLKPLKNETINILVDHKYYGNKNSRMYRNDKTEVFINSLLKYKQTHNLDVKHIGFGCVHDVTNEYKISEYKQVGAIDFREIYKYYNSAHIYIVTHQECFGLSVIECAAAGALIVTPAGYIKGPIIKELHHVSISDFNNIDWDNIIKKIDIKKSIAMAKKFSYQNTVAKLYKHMKTVEKQNNSKPLENQNALAAQNILKPVENKDPKN